MNHNTCRYYFDPPNTLTSGLAFRFRDQRDNGPSHGYGGSGTNYLVASGGTGKAKLWSPLIQQTYLFCTLDFYYYFNGTDMVNNRQTGEMSVILEQHDTGRQTVLWESTLEPMSRLYWRSLSIPLRRVKHPFRFIFQAAVSVQDPLKYHAIYYPHLSDCKPPSTSSSSCSSSYFTCTNRGCISVAFVCDGDGRYAPGSVLRFNFFPSFFALQMTVATEAMK